MSLVAVQSSVWSHPNSSQSLVAVHLYGLIPIAPMSLVAVQSVVSLWSHPNSSHVSSRRSVCSVWSHIAPMSRRQSGTRP